MSASPKYSSIEIERRWLVDLAAVGNLADMPYREIEGLYVEGSRFDSEAAAHAYRPPSFVTREITSDPAFTGVAIAGAPGAGLG